MQGNLKENPASGQILVGQADATYKPVTMSGDATIDETGAVTVSGGSSGVSQIIAGTNVTIEPSGGTGAVTINASGGGGGGGAVSQIAQTVLSANAASITFSDIPDTFENLMLVLSGASATAAVNDNIFFQVNGDTGGNYSFCRTITDGAANTVTAQNGSGGVNQGFGGTIPASQAIANQAGSMELLLPGYKRTVFFKSMISRAVGVSDDTTPTADIIIEHDASTWNNTDAINAVKLFLASGDDFVAGTVATLYGYM